MKDEIKFDFCFQILASHRFRSRFSWNFHKNNLFSLCIRLAVMRFSYVDCLFDAVPVEKPETVIQIMISFQT